MTILDPVSTIPPVVRQSVPYAKWSDCYDAARLAKGLWVPIELPDRVQARNLAFVAKKQQGIESVVQGTIAYLRVNVCGTSLTEADAVSGLVPTDAASHDERG